MDVSSSTIVTTRELRIRAFTISRLVRISTARPLEQKSCEVCGRCVGGVWGVIHVCLKQEENGQEKKVHLTTLDHMTRYITVKLIISQYTTVYPSILQYTIVYPSILQYTTVYPSILQYTTVYPSICQYTPVYHSILLAYCSILQPHCWVGPLPYW